MNNENKKWIISSFLAVAVLVWFITEKILFGVVDILNIPMYPLIGDLTLLTPIAIIPAGAFFVYFQKNIKIVEFTNEVILELKRIVWPPRKETSASTIIVLVLVFIASSILGVFDFLWVKILRFFI